MMDKDAGKNLSGDMTKAADDKCMSRALAKTAKKSKRIRQIVKNWDLYLILLVPLAYVIIFSYIPMYGAQIAFRRFNIAGGITGSEWVGLHYFIRFITSNQFSRVVVNTLMLSIIELAVGFPVPILLALMLNYCRSRKFKKTVQMLTYVPHFISVVVLCGMILQFLAPRYGIFNVVLQALGFPQNNFMGNPDNFRPIYVLSGIWQGAGFSSIIYLAVLSSVDPELHEAAIIDGALKIHRVWYIDLPTLLPTATILLILTCGGILSVGFEKVLLLQNPTNLIRSEVIQTYVYKVGLAADIPNYAYSTAIGLFTSVIGFMLLTSVNLMAKKLGQSSLW